MPWGIDHPILLLQHMLWHEGYHHGRMKLALEVAGRPMTDKEAGPALPSTWEQRQHEPAINRQFRFAKAAAFPFQPDTANDARMLYCIEWTIAGARARPSACSSSP
jgi:hypothetical protein